MKFDELPTPCYVMDEEKLKSNGRILQGIQARTGCRILLAQKSFSCFALYPLLSQYLAGTAASGLYEARLGAEEMPDRECHVFCTAYRDDQFDALLQYADHIIFNSFAQLERFGFRAKAAGKQIGLRINPEYSTQDGHALYNPCAPGSRLGVTREEWDEACYPPLLSLLDGLHLHTLCEQNSDALEQTVAAFELNFAEMLPHLRWLNLGGGHHITRPDYDIPRLERCVRRLQERYQLTVYLEPGEAVALQAGFLITEVLDLPRNGINLAILDTSAACHMPDVLEMPYRPPLRNAGQVLEKPYTYRLGGPTCLAGDIIGDYSFDAPLQVGDRLVFEDMAIYSMVKNNTFNGMPLPAIAVLQEDGSCSLLKTFGYADFKHRLS